MADCGPSARDLPIDFRYWRMRAPTSMPAMSCMPYGTDRQPELGQHAIDLLDARALLEQQVRLAHVVGEHAVGDEPEAVADDDADLAELLGELERRGDRLLARLASAHDLEQLHHVRRAEVVVAEHLRRPAARARELIDVERRRIRREDAVGPRHLAELGERGLLQVHVLEHRFGHDVHLVEAVVAGRRRDQRHRLLDLLRGHLALRHRDFVVAADRGDAAIERRLVHFLEQDRNAGVRVVHRDAAAHRARADDRGAFDLLGRRVLRARREPWPPRARRRTDGAAPSIRSRRRSRRTARARGSSPGRRAASARLRSRRRRRTARACPWRFSSATRASPRTPRARPSRRRRR